MKFLIPLALLTASIATAQTPDTLSLQGRNLLAVGLGLSGTREANAVAGKATTHTTGQVGSFAFTHFISPSLAIEVSTAALDADTYANSTGYGTASNDAITPLLFGLSYSPRSLALTTSIRPFLSAAAGPYFHVMTSASAGSGAHSSSQTAMGARLGSGVNWYVSHHFVLQLEADYHVVGKFEPVNGVRKDPSGFAISAGLGFAWGY
jgi:outer membrane protein W